MSRKRELSKKKPYRRKNIKRSNITTKDIKSKTIFHDPVLCCQFLRDYVDHPLLKDIQPEDIEDYTERYLSYFGVEFEADTVKRIRLRNVSEEFSELYLISLIEHKSMVDYNVVVQLLKYMTCIWAEYEKQFGVNYKNEVKTKQFRYPPILPVVYYEGAGTWTAPMHLRERIFMNGIFEEYIPDFTYCLVNNRDYTNEELLEHQDEMSLIMLLNKIQNATDLSHFLKISPEEINNIVQSSPETVIDIIVMVIQALCTKLNVSREDTEECVKKVRIRDMGYLWENMEKIDVQGTYDELVKMKKILAEERSRIERELAEERVKAEEMLAEERVKAEEMLAEERVKAEERLAKEREEKEKARLIAEDLQKEIVHLRSLLSEQKKS